MAITKLTTDMEVLKNLPDKLTNADGYPASYNKSLFEKPGVEVKSYINDVLTPELDTKFVDIENNNNSVVLQLAENENHLNSICINVKFPPDGIAAAKGDNSTDDTAAIQNIIDYVKTLGGGLIYFPTGVYLISNTITISNATTDTSLNITIKGENSQGTVIKTVGNTMTFDLFLVKTTVGNVRRLNISGINFQRGLNAIHGYMYTYSTISDCIFEYQANAGLLLEQAQTMTITNNNFLDTINTNGCGIDLKGMLGGAYGQNIISNNVFGEALYNGIFDSSIGTIISGNQFYWVQHYCIYANGGSQRKIIGNVFTGFGSDGTMGVYLLHSSNNEIVYNTFDNGRNQTNIGSYTTPALAAIYNTDSQNTKISENRIIGLSQTLSYAIVNDPTSDNIDMNNNRCIGITTILIQNASAKYRKFELDLSNNIANQTGLSFKLNGGAWNTEHFLLGAYHLWIDSVGKLRIKNGVPTTDLDGVVVGTQS